MRHIRLRKDSKSTICLLFMTLVFIGFMFFISFPSWADEPPYEMQWAMQKGSTGNDVGYGIAADLSGGIYVTGNAGASIDGQPASGGNDLFLMKYDVNGNWLWTRQLGTTGSEWANSVAVVKNYNGDVYVVGRTNGSLDGNLNAGQIDAFIVKYDSNGNKLWSKMIGSSRIDLAYAAGIDLLGNIYVTGRTNGALPGHTNLGGNDMFLLKYAPNGSLLWSRQVGTTGDDEAFALTIDNENRVYIAGYTTGSHDGPNAGGKDMLVMRFDSNGTFCCSKQYGTSIDDVATAVAIDSFGYIYILGNRGTSTLVLMKCDLYGTLWTIDLQVQVDEIVTSMNIDQMNNIYVAGHANINRDGLVDKDISVAKYDQNGQLIWSRQIGTNVDDKANSVTVDEYGSIYVTGFTNGNLFAANRGGSDVFVLKLVDSTSSTGGLKINSDAAYTNSASVTLNITCNDGSGSGCKDMRFSNDSINWSEWIHQMNAPSWTTSRPWTLPAGDGIKTVYVRFKDKAGNISTVFSNSITLHTTLIPNLTVSSINAPISAGSGSTITISDTTVNRGVGGVGRSTTAFYFSNNRVLDDDEFLGSRTVPSLAPGGGSTASISVTLPPDLDTGTYYIIAVADENSIVDETRENDNSISRPINIGPDLIVSVAAPSKAGAGIYITITDATTNIGHGAAEESTTGFYLSQDRTLSDDDIELGSRAVPALLGGAVSAGSTQVYIPSDIQNGTYFIIAKADVDNDVNEINERNNIKNRKITIGLDLTISSVSSPSTAISGSTIAITITTANRGPGISPPVITRLYLSEDNMLSEDDIEIDELQIESLSAGSAIAKTVYIDAPDEPETYFIIAKADADNDVSELNERNNIKSRRIKIIQGQ